MDLVPPKKSWMHRNWPWVVPTGGCLLLLAIIGFFVGSAFYSVKDYFTNFSEQITETIPIEPARKRIEEYPYLLETLGTPIEFGEPRTSNFNIVNGTTQITSQAEVLGSKAAATLYISGSKNKDSLWNYDAMYVVLKDTGEEVDLFFDGE